MRIAKPHSITDFDGSYVWTNLGNNADSLVSKDNAELHRMFIRKATSRVRDFDDRVLPPNFPLRRTLRNRPVLLPAINSEFNRHPFLSAIGVRTSRGGCCMTIPFGRLLCIWIAGVCYARQEGLRDRSTRDWISKIISGKSRARVMVGSRNDD
jgi:hypothetical protein